MDVKSFITHANGMDFYCEMMGQGPTIVIVPDGSNDCGPYEKMMEYLSDEFTVLTSILAVDHARPIRSHGL